MDTSRDISSLAQYADWSNDEIRAHIRQLEDLLHNRRVPANERIGLIQDPEVAEKVVAFCKTIRPTMSEMENDETLALPGIVINDFEHAITISANETDKLEAYLDELGVPKSEGEAEQKALPASEAS